MILIVSICVAYIHNIMTVGKSVLAKFLKRFMLAPSPGNRKKDVLGKIVYNPYLCISVSVTLLDIN